MEIPRHWRMKAQRYRLEGSVCPGCGRPMFPPRPLCARCASQTAQLTGRAQALLPDSICLIEFDPSSRLQIAERISG